VPGVDSAFQNEYHDIPGGKDGTTVIYVVRRRPKHHYAAYEFISVECIFHLHLTLFIGKGMSFDVCLQISEWDCNFGALTFTILLDDLLVCQLFWQMT
jgi:hypothetical protein